MKLAIFRMQEIRKMSKEERNKKLSELRAELAKMKAMQAMGGSLENPSRIRLLRKTIARFLTVNREEELGIARAKPKEEPQPKEAPKESAITEKPSKDNISEEEKSEEN